MKKRYVVSYLPKVGQHDHIATFENKAEATRNAKDVAEISEHNEAVVYEQILEDGEDPTLNWKTTRIGVQISGEELAWDDDNT